MDTNDALRRKPRTRTSTSSSRARRQAAGVPRFSTTRSTSTSRPEVSRAKKHQTQINVREIKFRPKIAEHDYDTKKGHVERFLKGK